MSPLLKKFELNCRTTRFLKITWTLNLCILAHNLCIWYFQNDSANILFYVTVQQLVAEYAMGCTYVCMYVCMYVCIYVCLYVSTYYFFSCLLCLKQCSMPARNRTDQYKVNRDSVKTTRTWFINTRSFMSLLENHQLRIVTSVQITI